MNEILSDSLFFGALISLITYFIGLAAARRFRHPLVNPLLISIALCVVFLLVTGIDYAVYKPGADRLTWLLTPATVAFAVPLYEQLDLLRRNLRAVCASIIAGVLTSAVTVFLVAFVCRLAVVDVITLFPKSITAAIGMPLAERLGGSGAVTAIAIAITGLTGNITAPLLLRLAHVTDPLAQGLAIGTASHALGTSRAIEMGEIQGAASGLALAVAGILTALLAPLVPMVL